MSLNTALKNLIDSDKKNIRRVAEVAVEEYFSGPMVEAEEAFRRAIKKVEGEGYGRSQN